MCNSSITLITCKLAFIVKPSVFIDTVKILSSYLQGEVELVGQFYPHMTTLERINVSFHSSLEPTTTEDVPACPLPTVDAFGRGVPLCQSSCTKLRQQLHLTLRKYRASGSYCSFA